MKLDFVKKREEWVSLVLIAASVGLGVLILLKISDYYVSQAEAGQTVATAIEKSRPDPNETRTRLGKVREVAGALKSQNLFAPPEPRQHPVREVAGILGGEVLIGDRWYKEGGRVGDATIVKIDPTKVTVEWDGSTKVFAPITAGSEGGDERGGRGGSSRGGSSNGSRSEGGPERTEVTRSGENGGPGRVEFGRGGPGGGDFRSRMENMSEREREEMFRRMRERFGGGGPGGFGGGPGGFGGRPGGFGGDRGGFGGDRGGFGGRGR